MSDFIVYELTNVKTGEKFVGTYIDISNRLGVSRGYISQREAEGGRICLDWKIEKVDKKMIVEKPNNHSIPYSLQEEWDKVTEPFKKLSIRKKNKGLKINHA